MTELNVQTRPEGVSHSHAARSRHRAEPAKQASALSRLAAGLGITGHRAAIVTVAGALLVGGGAASQAAEPGAHTANVAGAESVTSVDPLAKLNFERIQVTGSTTPPNSAVVSKAPEAKPAAAPAPAAHAAAPAKASPAAPARPAAPVHAAAPVPAAAPVAVDDPSGAQAYAAARLGSYGWAPGQMQCLQKLWTKESDWKTTATNASSGAYGVVQSLPASKMASAGADYMTNYRTQINWGLNYVKTRYGSPCGALDFHYAHNWY
ncbi:hypothetical protein AB4Y72_09620 [Arthrobacter sp. YAF34]|uniref:aggregation-promoting factor C-terminal-like domain-containing protein n=1 Tax=Arthrobacter sp. YAF34 TaxID=3233083 RepID=UPI003F925CA1